MENIANYMILISIFLLISPFFWSTSTSIFDVHPTYFAPFKFQSSFPPKTYFPSPNIVHEFYSSILFFFIFSCRLFLHQFSSPPCQLFSPMVHKLHKIIKRKKSPSRFIIVNDDKKSLEPNASLIQGDQLQLWFMNSLWQTQIWQ